MRNSSQNLKFKVITQYFERTNTTYIWLSCNSYSMMILPFKKIINLGPQISKRLNIAIALDAHD